MTLQYDQAFATLKKTALDIKAERDRYEATLRKIAAWRGYGDRTAMVRQRRAAHRIRARCE